MSISSGIITLFINGPVVHTSGIDLFEYGHQPLNSSGTLLIHGHQPIQSDIDLLLVGHQSVSASGTLFIEGWSILYIQQFETWNATSGGIWEEKDLSVYEIPANAIVEIAVNNTSKNNGANGGIRSFGSSIERRIELAYTESFAEPAVVGGTFIVQANDNSKIEIYASNTDDIEYVLLGYWSSGLYVDTMAPFVASSDDTWETYDLTAYGVSGNNVVDILMGTVNSSQFYSLGIRELYSANDRKVVVRRANDGASGIVPVSMLANAIQEGSSTNIAIYAENSNTAIFYLMGYFVETPLQAQYHEHFDILDDATSDNTWQPLQLGPDHDGQSIDILLSHQSNAADNSLGIRRSNSILPRIINFAISKGTGDPISNSIRMHVASCCKAQIETYAADASDDHAFVMLGHWDLVIKKHHSLVVTGHIDVSGSIPLFVESHETTQSEISLFAHGPELSASDADLFINGCVAQSSAIDLFIHGYRIETSGLDLMLHGHATESSDIDLHLHGHQPITNGNIGLYIKLHGASGLLDPENVIFYHKLDDKTEHTLADAWIGDAAFVPGIIGSGVSAIASDAVAWGNGSEIASYKSVPQGITALSSSKVAVIYHKTDGLGCFARIGDIDGTNVSWSAEKEIRQGDDAILHMAIIAMDSSKILIITGGWISSEDHESRAYVGTVSGSTITLGSYQIWAPRLAHPGSDCRLSRIDDTTFVVGYTERTSYAGSIKVGTISGTTPSFGSAYTFTSGAGADGLAIAVLSNTKFVVTYEDRNDNQVKAIIGDISGTTIAYGTPYVLDTNDPRHAISIVALDSDTFMAAWNLTTPTASYDDTGKTCIGTVSGTSITVGSGVEFGPDVNYNVYNFEAIGLSKLSPTTVVINWCGWDDVANASQSKVATISGTMITFGQKTSNTDLSSYLVATALDSSKLIYAFDLLNDGGKGRAYVGLVDDIADMTTTNNNYPDPIGIDHIACGFWSSNLIKNGATATIRRTYEINIASGIITFGDNTAEWAGAGVVSMLDDINDGVPHYTVLDFYNETSGWRLRTSVDGSGFVDQGLSTSGTQPLASSSTDPMIQTYNPNMVDAWLDELVLWGADSDIFDEFSDFELEKLEFLASYHDAPMSEYALRGLVKSGVAALHTIGHADIGSGGTLFVYGHTPINAAITELIWGNQPLSSGTNLFINGHLVQTSAIDLFIHGYQTLPSSIELLIDGHEPLSSGIDLITIGHQPLISGLNLFINGHMINTSGIDLFIDGHQPSTSDIDLLIYSKDIISSGIDLFEYGHQLESSNITLYIGPSESADDGVLLVIHGRQPIQSGIDLLINGYIVETSGISLFTIGPAAFQNSVDMSITGHCAPADDMTLYMYGHIAIDNDAMLHIWGRDTIDSDIAKFVCGHEVLAADTTLHMHGHLEINNDETLHMWGHDTVDSDITKLIWGHEPLAAGVTLHIHGHVDLDSDDDLFPESLFIWGHLEISDGTVGLLITGIPVPEEGMLNRLIKTADHNPQIIGNFLSGQSSVTIEVWNVIGGVNEKLTLADDACYPIGSTGRWGWSTAHLPASHGNVGQYVFRMTGDTAEVFPGEFFLDSPEQGKWKIPRDRNDFLV